ncbi:succinate dehydrogenase, hydrophobic membrane anchor protein [Caldimonas tepidiphila]|uniref:succinate dehydrogenase, hydrophobic membrane anchor protein n=1 Tax=Caldimonas tepidiphila TaxID=2315841 RepID=UPI000E5A67D2|nr:succinate dehydrogenase, hydrophobic membrane anchor protein [Caldimonas tepidiphila]
MAIRTFTGMRAWTVQRVSALYLLLFTVGFLVALLLQRPAGFEAWRAWVLQPGMRLALLMFFVAVAFHAWVGVRDITLDYVKSLPLRAVVLSLAAGGLLASVGWAALVLLQSRS